MSTKVAQNSLRENISSTSQHLPSSQHLKYFTEVILDYLTHFSKVLVAASSVHQTKPDYRISNIDQFDYYYVERSNDFG